MANRLRVPFELAVFERQAVAFAALKSAAVDFMATNATADRAKDVDFTQEILQAEQGSLVPRDSPFTTLNDVDRPAVRVGYRTRRDERE